MRRESSGPLRRAGMVAGVAAVFVTGITLAGVGAAAPTVGTASQTRAAQNTPTTIELPNLATRAAVIRYVRSRGIDPTGLVIQRGARNYAGPNCPGKSWNCTRATKVVQIATPRTRARTVVGARAVGGAEEEHRERLRVHTDAL